MKVWAMTAAAIVVSGAMGCASEDAVGAGTGEMISGGEPAGGSEPSGGADRAPAPEGARDESAPTARLGVSDLDGDGADEEFTSFDPIGTGAGNTDWQVHLSTKPGEAVGTVNGIRILPLEDGSAERPSSFLVYGRINGATCNDHTLTRYEWEDGKYAEKSTKSCDDALAKVKDFMEQQGMSVDEAWLHVSQLEGVCLSVLPDPCKDPTHPPQ